MERLCFFFLRRKKGRKARFQGRFKVKIVKELLKFVKVKGVKYEAIED